MSTIHDLIEKVVTEEVEKRLSGAPKPLSIGIGVTTHNRPAALDKTLTKLREHTPNAEIVIVDDGSNVPVEGAHYRFESAMGIAVAKNKCLELLEHCEHIFLFDDDCFPIVDEWYLPYINSGEPHLMYIFQDFANGKRLNDNVMYYNDGKLKAFTHPRGVMLYLHRKCLDVVGGMDPIFGRWGWEHPDLSNRIFNAGLSTFRYADVVGSEKLIHSMDEHQQVTTTVNGKERQQQIQRNKSIYESRLLSSAYVPYKRPNNIILTCFFTKVTDTQRGEKWQPEFERLDSLIWTCKAHMCRLVVLTDCDAWPNIDGVEFVKVHTCVNPYFQRWFAYRSYIAANKVDNVFCVDGTDVEVLRNPFDELRPGRLYVGDECTTIDEPHKDPATRWLFKNHAEMRVREFMETNAFRQLVNAGVCGGSRDVVLAFTRALVDYYTETKHAVHFSGAKDVGLTDMAAFNYIAYTQFGDVMEKGRHVTTVFKGEEKGNTYAMFKHK